MENTLENKQKFFGIYLGQSVLEAHWGRPGRLIVSAHTFEHLKPHNRLVLRYCKSSADLDSSTINKLRLEGYALPWMNMSVNKLVEWDWVRLEDWWTDYES